MTDQARAALMELLWVYNFEGVLENLMHIANEEWSARRQLNRDDPVLGELSYLSDKLGPLAYYAGKHAL